MGFRFQRRIRILPGLRLNVSKSGVSTSVGRRGAWFTFGPRGTRTTVGIPGTGISYTEQSSSANARSSLPSAEMSPSHAMEQVAAPPPSAPPEPEPLTISASSLILALAAIVALIAAGIALLR